MLEIFRCYTMLIKICLRAFNCILLLKNPNILDTL
uniref:Uncharacterized protein n=1 Tax=Rhizophora mucronata TaxID=61149 RepID=A0A2P2P2Q1_RHIMU